MSADRMSAKHLSNPQSRITTAELSQMLHRHFPHGAPTEAAPEEMRDLYRLWFELDWLRFEVAGQRGRADTLRDQLQELEGKYWALQMHKVPGGKI
jgi:hypothetical protein